MGLPTARRPVPTETDLIACACKGEKIGWSKNILLLWEYAYNKESDIGNWGVQKSRGLCFMQHYNITIDHRTESVYYMKKIYLIDNHHE